VLDVSEVVHEVLPSSLTILTVTLPAGPPPKSVTDTVKVTASPMLDGLGSWLRILTSNTPLGKVGVNVGVDVLVGVFVRVGVEVVVKIGDGVYVMKIVGVRVGVGDGVRVGVFVGVLLGMIVGVEVETGPSNRKLNASTSLAVRPQVLPSKYKAGA